MASVCLDLGQRGIGMPRYGVWDARLRVFGV